MKKSTPSLQVVSQTENPRIANVAIWGELTDDGVVEAVEPEISPVFYAFFNNPNCIWVVVETDAIASSAPMGSWVRMEWLSVSEYDAAVDKLCLLQLGVNAWMGRLRKENLEFFVETEKGRSPSGRKPHNIAHVSAIVFPDLNGAAER